MTIETASLTVKITDGHSLVVVEPKRDHAWVLDFQDLADIGEHPTFDAIAHGDTNVVALKFENLGARKAGRQARPARRNQKAEAIMKGHYEILDIDEFIAPGDLKRMAAWANKAHALFVADSWDKRADDEAKRNAVWLDVEEAMVGIAIALYPPGGVIVEFWQYDSYCIIDDDEEGGTVCSPCHSFGQCELPFILAAMPKVEAIIKTWGELYPRGPGGTGSGPDRDSEEEGNVIELSRRRAA